MAKYIFAYHGGGMPDTPEEGEKQMAAWMDWYASMGEAVVDGGAPAGMSKTVNQGGSVSDDGGSNPISGYTVVEAESHDAAVEMAKGCPILQNGSVEVAPLMDM